MITIIKKILNIICLTVFEEEIYNEDFLIDADKLLPPEEPPKEPIENQKEKPKFTEEELEPVRKMFLTAFILFYIGVFLFLFDDSDW